MVRQMKGIARAAIAVLCAALVASFAGALHPLGDSLAVFRTGIAALGLVMLPLARPGRGAAVAIVAVCLAGLATVGWHKLPRGVAVAGPGTGAGALTLYQKNMHYRDADIAALARDIRAMAPDIVTLQEVSVENEALLDLLWDVYPAQHLCRYTSDSGLAVLTRHSVTGSPVCGQAVGLAGLRVMTAQGPVWALSVHLAHPWPGRQRAQLDRLGPELRALAGPRVIGGDFNMVPWSHALRRVARQSGTRRADPARTSFRLGPVPLSIDHVLAPGGGWADPRPRLGSDHAGILARVHVWRR